MDKQSTLVSPKCLLGSISLSVYGGAANKERMKTPFFFLLAALRVLAVSNKEPGGKRESGDKVAACGGKGCSSHPASFLPSLEPEAHMRPACSNELRSPN